MPRRTVIIQPRDEAIIQHVAEHRFLRSSHIKNLVRFPSDRSCQGRLKELREAQFLHQIEHSFGDYREGGGTNPYIHALGNRGAELLATRHKIWMSPRYTETNNAVSGFHIDHELELADFMVAVELQCRERGDVELVPFYEILSSAPEHTKQNRKPRQWKVAVEWKRKTYGSSVTPDKIFGLRDLNRPHGGQRAFFFLEVDRGNETVDPIQKKFPKTSIFNKLLEYGHTYADGLHRKHYNLHSFRVLFVTTTQTRVENFIDVYRRHIRSHPLKTLPGLFLFTHSEALSQHASDILSVPWMDGSGKRVMLLGE